MRPYKYALLGNLKYATLILTPDQVLKLDTVPVPIVSPNSPIDMIMPAIFALHKPLGNAVYTTTANFLFDVNGTTFNTIALNSDAAMNLTVNAERVYSNRPAAGTITTSLAGFGMRVKASGAITGTGDLPPLKVYLAYWSIDPLTWDQKNVQF